MEGLTCGGCVKKLKTKLDALEKVEMAHVTLKPGQATIHGSIPQEQVLQQIRQAGFEGMLIS